MSWGALVVTATGSTGVHIWTTVLLHHLHTKETWLHGKNPVGITIIQGDSGHDITEIAWDTTENGEREEI